MALAATVALGTTVGKTIAGFSAAKQQTQAIRSQELQSRLAASQQSIARAQDLRRILGTQVAQGAARGLGASSASFVAIQRDTFNEFARDQDAANLNLEVQQDFLKQQKRNVKDKAILGAVTNIFEAANFMNDIQVPDVGFQPQQFNLFGKAIQPGSEFVTEAQPVFFDSIENTHGETL